MCQSEFSSNCPTQFGVNIAPLGEHRNQGRQDHGVRILSYNLNKYIQVTPNETFFQNMIHTILVLAICQQRFQELNSNLGKN